MNRQDRLRIAFVNQPWNVLDPPVQKGSIAILTYEIAKRLAGSCDVTVYTKRGKHRDSVHDGVRYRGIPVEIERKAVGHLGRIFRGRDPKRPFFSSRYYFLGYALQVAFDMRRRGVDLAQIFNLSQFAPIIRYFNPKTKIVLRMSCEWLNQLDPRIIRPRLAQIDSVVGCSAFITDKIREAHPQSADHCRTILNGRNVNAPARNGQTEKRQNDRERRLLFVGRVSPEKGIHVLIEAYLKVLERFPKTRLDIVGPQATTQREFIVDLSDDPRVTELARFYQSGKSYLEFLKSMVPPGVAELVSFAGHVPHTELNARYIKADAFVFPSIWDEPSGNPPIEAMTQGLPVISTRTGGTPEYVEDGTTGLLVAPGDPEELATAITRLFEDADLSDRMGKAGRLRAVNMFSYERMAADLLELYRDVCNE